MAELRKEVAFVCSEFQQTERTACTLLGLDRSSYRYERGPEPGWGEELVQLARQKPRFGYRPLHAVLEHRGEAVNGKRIYRLYTEASPTVRRRRRKRLVRIHCLGTADPAQSGWAMASSWTGSGTDAWCAS